MKVKTSITLSADVLRGIDRHGDEFASRSAFLEAAARDYLSALELAAADRRDRELLDVNADALNAEAEDVLAYQVSL